MNWVNIRTESLRSGLVMEAEPKALGIWLRVLSYCCEQENSGRIKGAATWSDRQWLMSCGVSKKDVEYSRPLVVSDGVDVVVEMYPLDKQREVKKDRLNGRRGGSSKTQAKTQASRENGTQGRRPKKPKPNPSQNPTERKGKERNNNGRGKEEEVSTPPFGRRTRMTLDELRAFAVSIELPETDGEAIFNKWEGNGWTNGGKPIRDCCATIRSWKAQNYLPSQKLNGHKHRTSADIDTAKTGIIDASVQDRFI